MSNNSSPRRIRILSTLLSEQSDPDAFMTNFKMVRLSLYGFSTRGITKHTGLSAGQVSSRIRLYKLQGVRGRFRDGQTKEARIVRDMVINVPGEERQTAAQHYNEVRNRVISELNRLRKSKKSREQKSAAH
jgi:hypothetical protein